MKRIFYVLVTLFVTFSVSGCASMIGVQEQADRTFSIAYKPVFGNFRTSASVAGAEYLKAQEDQRAAKELREPNYALIPAVGIIRIRINDGFLEGANPKNSLYILHDNTGREIYRANGQATIPSYDVSTYNGSTSTIWTAFDSIILDDNTVKFPLTLRVVRLGDETITITISKSGQ